MSLCCAVFLPSDTGNSIPEHRDLFDRFRHWMELDSILVQWSLVEDFVNFDVGLDVFLHEITTEVAHGVVDRPCSKLLYVACLRNVLAKLPVVHDVYVRVANVAAFGILRTYSEAYIVLEFKHELVCDSCLFV